MTNSDTRTGYEKSSIPIKLVQVPTKIDNGFIFSWDKNRLYLEKYLIVTLLALNKVHIQPFNSINKEKQSEEHNIIFNKKPRQRASCVDYIYPKND